MSYLISYISRCCTTPVNLAFVISYTSSSLSLTLPQITMLPLSYLISSQSRLRYGWCCGVGGSLCVWLSTTTSRYINTTEHTLLTQRNIPSQHTLSVHPFNKQYQYNTIRQTVLHHIHVTYISISVFPKYPINSVFYIILSTTCSCQQSAIYLDNRCKLAVLRASPSSNA